MVNNHSFVPNLQFIIIILICVQCINAKSSINHHLYPFNFEQIKFDLFSTKDFAKADKFSEFNSRNLTAQHRQCLIELNAIENGVKNFEPWAVQLFDAWAKMPSGILNGNFMEFGSFAQCFNVKRNEQIYETQYCLGHLTFHSDELIAMMNKNLFIKPPKNFPQAISYEPGFSFGICLPSACSIDHLRALIDERINTRTSDISVEIPENVCQTETETKELETVDLIAIVFVTIISAMVAFSTGYDIICTKNGRTKYPQYLAFSLYTNGKKLISMQNSESPDVIKCLHGIRVLSTQWIVFGHICLMYGLFPVQNKGSLTMLSREFYSVSIFAALISVDTFFTLSGLLVSINILKHLEKHGKINIWKLYAHRLLRLTPLMGATILLSMSLIRFMGNGPVWPLSMDYLRQSCQQYWWSSILYIQNYVNPETYCMMHTWYLNVDMQLFIIAPFIVNLIYRFKTKALCALAVVVLGCVFTTVAVHLKYGLKTLRMNGKMEMVYFPTHIRFSPWLVGVIAGYIFFESRQKSIQIPKMLNWFAWTISLATMAVVICLTYPLEQLDSEFQPIHYGLYDGLSRVAWSIALCYIIFACAHNAGGPVNQFLSHPLWQPFSRLCYSIYLVHIPIIVSMAATMKTPYYFTHLSLLQNIILTYTFTVLVSAIATLIFESPIVTIEKLIFNEKGKFQHQNGSNEVNKLNGVNETTQQNGVKHKNL